MATSILQSAKNQLTIIVIFGATGDLARKKLFPALYELYKANLLPEKFKIVAAARSVYSSPEFAKSLEEYIPKKEDHWADFSKTIKYIVSDIAENKNLHFIGEYIQNFENEIGSCPQRVFYMAISPFIFEKSISNLGALGLNKGCTTHQNPARIVVEKPFGFDFESSQKLNTLLSKYFDERQIYRIDHFLGKETVQNIFAFRFGNELFEPIWNSKYIDHIQINFAEYIGIEKRGDYYDKAGALRDVVQNHLLQLLTLITMDEPKAFDQSSFREKKLEILKNIRKLSAQEIAKNTVRGQYEGYRQEENVDPKSQTETFALTKFFVDTPRWQNVPIYIRTGKKLAGKVTSIIIVLKERGHNLFKGFQNANFPNHITLQIQPNEGIGIRLTAKKPGLTTTLEPVDMEFCYKKSFDSLQPDAYERLILDVICADQTLFIGPVGQSWKIIDPIVQAWKEEKPKLVTYKPGTWGPKEADNLIEKDGREWLAPLLTICKI